MTVKYPHTKKQLEVEIEIENYHLVSGHCKCDYPSDNLPHCGLCMRDL